MRFKQKDLLKTVNTYERTMVTLCQCVRIDGDLWHMVFSYGGKAYRAEAIRDPETLKVIRFNGPDVLDLPEVKAVWKRTCTYELVK